jgi:hypothetical protein
MSVFMLGKILIWAIEEFEIIGMMLHAKKLH